MDYTNPTEFRSAAGGTMLNSANERKHRRYSLKYPVHLKFGSASEMEELQAVSVNVSVGGMLLKTASIIPEHTSVSFLMTLDGGRILRPIQLVGGGHVVRVETSETAPGFHIAVQCNEPIAEIDTFLANA
jgi:PilZ domain